MSAFWVYTAARFGVLLAAFGVLYVAGARGLLLIIVAFAVSAVISYFLLAGMRNRFTAHVQARAERINERMDAAARAEDGPDPLDG